MTHFIIFDLEATCWRGNKMGRQQEIIEIGACRVDSYGVVGDTFHSFVRPVLNPDLSVYCKKLTGIPQESIDGADVFKEVIEHYVEWIYSAGESIVHGSWGSIDLRLLRDDCSLHEVDADWVYPCMDLKSQYHQIKNIPKKKGLRRVLQDEGFSFDGNHHRALDDASNLCKIFVKYLDMWMY